MKVVILKTHQIKNVADGYARNYLIPNGLAVPATDEHIKKAEEKQGKQEEAQAEQHSSWQALQEKVSTTIVAVESQANEDGTLFAALPEKEIAAAISTAAGTTVQEAWVKVSEPIKHTGEYTVELSSPGENSLEVKIEVK